MKFEVQKADTISRNGRIYPAHVLAKAIAAWQPEVVSRQAFVFVANGTNTDTKVNDLVGVVTAVSLNSGLLVAEVDRLNGPSSSEIWPLLESGRMALRLTGIGNTTRREDGVRVVNDDYGITHLSATNNPA